MGTPVYLAYAAPHLAGYLLHSSLLLIQLVPYILCAIFWLPWSAPEAGRAGVIFAALLLLAAMVLYMPMLWDPSAQGGDMIGLAFVAISLGSSAVLLLSSAVVFLVLRWRARARQGRKPERMAP